MTTPAIATSPYSSPSASFHLVRVWHVETLSTVAAHPEAPRFFRTSYGIVPSGWLKLDDAGVRDRILYALELSYRSRNFQSARSGDPAEMLWVAVGHELVERIAMPPYIDGYEEEDLERVSVRVDRVIHPDVIDAAASDVIARWYMERPGLDARPWTRAFTAFRYEADGDMCHLIRRRDRAQAFEEAFGRPPAQVGA